MSRMSLRARRPRQVLVTVCIALLSLLCVTVVFHLVTRSIQPGEPDAGPAANQPSVTAIPDRLPPLSVVASGQQLFSLAPLANIHQDQGSTIPLPDGRTLWIFADTFQQHTEPSFFHTSAAAVTDPGQWELQYSMGERSGAGVHFPTEFLPRTAAEQADHLTKDHYIAVWPTGSTLLPSGRILISYAKYRVLLKDENQFVFLGAGLFTFQYRGFRRFTAGDHATRVADNLWGPDVGAVRSPIYEDGYVYFTECSNLQCYPLRTTPEHLTSRRSYTWWTGSGWSSDLSRRQPMVVGTGHPGGNASIVHLKNGLYAMADTEAGVVSGVGYLWVAPHPWGPWSDASAFLMPGCPAAGCYGLNLHPEASTATSLRVSYATGEHDPNVRVYDIPVRIGAGGDLVSAQ